VLGYVSLTKPRVIELLLVTTIPAMLLAHRGSADMLLILNTLFGGMLAAGGANALNCVADADIDKVMKRTAGRPLARATVPRSHALIFGLALSVGSFFWLWWTTNMLSAHLAAATIAFYVLVYTLLLKRRTSQNVVWGGAAGCMPVMIGWSAVTGTIGWQALVMFAIIFFWTPPHTWALAMRYKEGVDGISIFDEHGNQMGTSVSAGRASLVQVALTRAALPVPILLVPPFVLDAIGTTKLGAAMARSAPLKLGVELGVVACFLQGALPFALALFPQRGSIAAEQLEPEFRGRVSPTTKQPVATYYYNKGL
jgi:protoheme IX farnesyltransferase